MNTIVGTLNPASASNAFSSAASILARERSVVSKRTLPVLMYVATSVKPAASTASMIDVLRELPRRPEVDRPQEADVRRHARIIHRAMSSRA